jgi:hypothetical protein
MHIEFLVEEDSCAAALEILWPKLRGASNCSREIRSFQGKSNLLKQLPARLRAYKNYMPKDWRIVVLVDRDTDDCFALKKKMETIAAEAGLSTKTSTPDKASFQVLNRIAIEELEAWFFGDAEALSTAFPKVPKTLPKRRGFRTPDAISGGTWETLERVLQTAGYYRAGMPKIEVARSIATQMNPERNTSKSFCAFRDALRLILV